MSEFIYTYKFFIKNSRILWGAFQTWIKNQFFRKYSANFTEVLETNLARLPVAFRRRRFGIVTSLGMSTIILLCRPRNSRAEVLTRRIVTWSWHILDQSRVTRSCLRISVCMQLILQRQWSYHHIASSDKIKSDKIKKIK